MKKIIFLTLLLFFVLNISAQNKAPETSQVSVNVPNNAEPPKPNQKGSFCDPNFEGERMTFSAFSNLYLDDLLAQIHNRFGINFLITKKVGNLPITVNVTNIPWGTLLRSQLFLLGISSECKDNNTIQLVKNDELSVLEREALDASKLETVYIKLKYLQPTAGGNVNLAGNSSRQNNQQGCQGGGPSGGQLNYGQNSSGQGNQSCGTFEKLINVIADVLGINNREYGATQETLESDYNDSKGTDTTKYKRGSVVRRGAVFQIPGRNILVVRGNAKQLEQIYKIIAKADRPPFQVIIKGLVYTANETRLRDIGVQTSITAGTADRRTTGDILGHTLGSAGTLFDFSTIIGTNLFSVQANALQQNGIIAIKSRPFATVLDGETADLEVGRQIPVLTQGSVVGGQAGNLEFIGASNLLSVTPFVIDDDNGNPVGVNLQLQLESNEVDTAVISQGIPTVNRRSIQTRLVFNQDKTIILGGFTVDSNSNDVSKTPGLGDIPILGYLFKRKVKRSEINRLYFAISVEIVPYGQLIEPVKVPGATTDVPTVTQEMLKPLGKEGLNSSAKPAPEQNKPTENNVPVKDEKSAVNTETVKKP